MVPLDSGGTEQGIDFALAQHQQVGPLELRQSPMLEEKT